MTTDTIISKVWSFCTTLRDDGVDYGDYLEQLTYLIFLKMADEYGRPPYNRDVGVPKKYSWAALKKLKGAELKIFFTRNLTKGGFSGSVAYAPAPSSRRARLFRALSCYVPCGGQADYFRGEGACAVFEAGEGVCGVWRN